MWGGGVSLEEIERTMEEVRWKIMITMNTIQEVNPAQAYFKGMLWAAFGVRIFSDNVAE